MISPTVGATLVVALFPVAPSPHIATRAPTRGAPNNDDPVDVIRHDYKTIQADIWIPRRQSIPRRFHRAACVVQPHFAVPYHSEQACALSCADRHKIRARHGVIIASAAGSTDDDAFPSHISCNTTHLSGLRRSAFSAHWPLSKLLHFLQQLPLATYSLKLCSLIRCYPPAN